MHRLVLVMSEYCVGDSPLWHRGSTDDIGVADATELGLSQRLRGDLRAWNDVYDARGEPDFDWPSAAVATAHGLEAFALAARVQRELGDDTHVWCGAGEGIDVVLERGTAVVLSATRPGTDVEHWQRGQCDLGRAADLGAGRDAARALIGWRAQTERTGRPFGTAETRALGLLAAREVQRDIGDRAQVVFFAGAPGPYSVDEIG